MFFFYDWLMQGAQRLVDFYVGKIGSGKGKKGGKKPPQGTQGREDAADVFEGFGGKDMEENGDAHGPAKK